MNSMGKIWLEKRLVKAKLVNLAARDPQALIRSCEASYRAGVERAAQEIINRQSKLVLLAGPSGSGKTTSAKKLVEVLEAHGCPAQHIAMDDFYRSLDDYPRLPDGTKDYENVTALDLPLLHSCLDELLTQGKTELPIFDFESEMRRPETRPVSLNGGVVVMEGIHALNPLVSQGLDSRHLFKIYAGVREEYCDNEGKNILDAKELRLARRTLRDTRRGRDAEETIAKGPQVDQGEELYIRRYKLQAHYILDTAFSYEPCVLAGILPRVYRAISPQSQSYATARRLTRALEQFQPIPWELVPQDSMLQEFL